MPREVGERSRTRRLPAGGGSSLVAVLLVALNLRGAIAAVSPVLPQIRADLGLSATAAGQAGTVTGVYTAALAGGAAAAAALTAPVAAVWSWRGALAVWAVLALVAAAVWAATTRRHAGLPVRAVTTTGERTPEAPDAAAAPSGGWEPDPRMWPEPLAWVVALFLGCQSICYYAVTAWLPTLLIEDVGVPPDLAGGAMSTFQLLGIGGTLLIPLSGRRPNQSWLGLCLVLGWVVLGVGLLLWPSAWPA